MTEIQLINKFWETYGWMIQRLMFVRDSLNMNTKEFDSVFMKLQPCTASSPGKLSRQVLACVEHIHKYRWQWSKGVSSKKNNFENLDARDQAILSSFTSHED